MDGNYEWQQFRAHERSKAQLQEAEVHRLAKEGGNGRLPFLTSIAIRIKSARSAWKRFRQKHVPARDAKEKRERFV